MKNENSFYAALTSMSDQDRMILLTMSTQYQAEK
mgnify:CR=1 FL=1